MQEDGLSAVLNDIKTAKKTIADIFENDLVQSQDSERLVYFLHALRIFQAEFSAHLKAWNEITQIVEVPHTQSWCRSIYMTFILQEAVQSGPSAVVTYEVIADILVCTTVTFAYLPWFSDDGNSGLTSPVRYIVCAFSFLSYSPIEHCLC